MTDHGIGSWIERRARVAPDRIAVISGARTWTNAQLAERIRRLAHGLASLGVERGDRVCWVGANHPAFLEALFATARLGAILAPVNHRLGADEIRSILVEMDPKVLFLGTTDHAGTPDHRAGTTDHGAGTSVRSAAASDYSARTSDHRAGPSDHGAGTALEGVPLVTAAGSAAPDGIAVEDLLARSPDAAIDVAVGLEDVCMIPHTSGTTGSPKGVTLTHGNITWNAVNMLASTDLRADDVTIAIAPFFRVGGTGVNVLPVLFQGGAVVIPPDPPEPDELLALIQRHRITVGFANPDLLDALTRAESWPTCDLTSLRYIITGGAPVPARMLRTFLDRGVPCLQGYGLSEAAPVVLLLPPEHALDRLGSAGVPVMMVDVRIVGPGGEVCAPNEAGELIVSGPNVMAGYWGLPAETAQTIDDQGWLHTGDAARVDADGFVWIVDRLADGYDTAGGRVFPSDVDRVLVEHPAVADAASVGIASVGIASVGDAYVGDASVGVASATGLAQTHSFVVLAAGRPATEDDLIAFCRSRLPAHAAPVRVTFVDSLPRNSVGKVQRWRLGAPRDS